MLEKASIGPREGTFPTGMRTLARQSLSLHRVVADLSSRSRAPLDFPSQHPESKPKKTGIDIGGSDDGLSTGPQQLSAPSSREARGGNVSAVASRLKPDFLKGQRAYLVGTSCYLPPKEDFVHKTFLINAIRKSVSFMSVSGIARDGIGASLRRERSELRGTRKLIEDCRRFFFFIRICRICKARSNFATAKFRYARLGCSLFPSADAERCSRQRHREGEGANRAGGERARERGSERREERRRSQRAKAQSFRAAGGKSGWSDENRGKKTRLKKKKKKHRPPPQKKKKQGYFNEVALAFMEKVLDASGLAEKVRTRRDKRRERGRRGTTKEDPVFVRA